MEGVLCANTVILEGFLSSLMEVVVLETTIAASMALVFVTFHGFLPNRSSIFPEESGTSRGFPLTDLYTKKKPDPENQEGIDIEDDKEVDDEDGQDDQDDDDDAGDEEDEPEKDGEDPEDEPKANGDGGSDDNYEEDDDDEEDQDDEDDDDEEKDEKGYEEDITQPHTKSRK